MSVLNFFNKASAGIGSVITSGAEKLASGVGVLDPKMGRLLASGLGVGGKKPGPGGASPKIDTKVTFSGQKQEDWRVRVSVGDNSNVLYKDPTPGNLLYPLIATNGVIFPYTPKIDIVYQTNYTDQDIVHTNYSYYAYNKSSVSSITINAEFTAQTPEEAKYVLAVIHFFRSAGKMFSGTDQRLAGNPPPMLFLNGYGDHYFPNVPCVLTQFSHSMPDDVDYITAPTVNLKDWRDAQSQEAGLGAKPNSMGAATFRTKIPVISTMTIMLQPVYSRKKVSEFSLETFARGGYLEGGKKRGYI